MPGSAYRASSSAFGDCYRTPFSGPQLEGTPSDRRGPRTVVQDGVTGGHLRTEDAQVIGLFEGRLPVLQGLLAVRSHLVLDQLPVLLFLRHVEPLRLGRLEEESRDLVVRLGRHHEGGNRPAGTRVLGHLQPGRLDGLVGLQLLLDQGVLDLVSLDGDLLECRHLLAGPVEPSLRGKGPLLRRHGGGRGSDLPGELLVHLLEYLHRLAAASLLIEGISVQEHPLHFLRFPAHQRTGAGKDLGRVLELLVLIQKFLLHVRASAAGGSRGIAFW